MGPIWPKYDYFSAIGPPSPARIHTSLSYEKFDKTND